MDWERLDNAFRDTSPDVPRLIRSLTSDDRETREDAEFELHDTINHQGSIGEITANAVPFLIELLSSDVVHGKYHSLDLLYEIGRTAPMQEEDEEDGLRWRCEQMGWDYNVVVTRWRAVRQNVLAALRDGSDAYLALLNDPEPNIRALVGVALPLLVQDSSRAFPAILSRLKVEVDRGVQASLAWSLGDVSTDDPSVAASDKAEALALLRRLIEDGKTPQIRFSAARALLRGQTEDIPPEAIIVLLDGIAQPDLYRPLPSLDALSTIDASLALCRLDSEKRLEAFRTALEVTPTFLGAHMIAPKLLDCALLGIPEPRHWNWAAGGASGTHYRERPDNTLDIQSLSSEQKETLSIVLEADRVWEGANNLLAVYGLPPLRDEARELLDLV